MDTRESVSKAVDAIADNTRQAAGAVAEAAGKAVDAVKGKTGIGASGVREHMDVMASCGTKVGVVDRVEGEAIKLTKNDSPDGKHHYLPLSAVASVDTSVHLSMDKAGCAGAMKDTAEACC